MTTSESLSAVLRRATCSKANQPLMRFCEQCGTPLRANVKPRVVTSRHEVVLKACTSRRGPLNQR